MSENLHDIDKLFRDAIEGHEDMPGEKLWDAVDAGLDKSNVVHIKRKYNNLKRIAAVLLLLLLTVVGYEIFKPASSGKDIAGSQKQQGENATADKISKDPANKETAGSQPQNNTALTDKSAQSNSVTNAGYDSLNSNTPAAANSTSQDNNMVKSPVAKKVTVNSSAVSNGNNSVTVNTKTADQASKKQSAVLPVSGGHTDNDGAVLSKSAGNKSLNSKTKVKIKSPLPQQYEDEKGVSANDLAADKASVQTELQPLLNSRVSTLAGRINNAIDQKEMMAANRLAPDVQIKKIRNKRSYRFSIMPYAAPQLFASTVFREEKKSTMQSYSPGGPPPPRPGRDNHKEQYKSDEQTQTVFTAGIVAEIPLGKKWFIQSGISHTQKNIRIEPKKIYARPDKDGKVKYVFDCSSGYSYISSKTGTTPVAGDSITVSSSKNTLGYIGVPLAVNYKVALGKKISIIPSVGTVFNFLTKQKIRTQLVQGTVKEEQTINKIEGMRSSYFAATAGMAFEYDVNKRIAINIMPSGNFALTSINKDAGVQSYPNAFGVSGGVKIKF